RHLEVAVLLVAARVGPERHPGVVGRIDGAPRVLGHVREGGAPGRPAHGGHQAVADRLQLGADAALDLLHAGTEALDVEHPEVGVVEGGSGHRGSPMYAGAPKWPPHPPAFGAARRSRAAPLAGWRFVPHPWSSRS